MVRGLLLGIAIEQLAQEATSAPEQASSVVATGTSVVSQGTVQQTLVTAAPQPKKSEDLRLSDFCRRDVESLEGALNCTEALEDIAERQEQAYEKSEEKGGRRLGQILKEAKSKIKSAIARAYSIATDSATLEEVDSQVAEIVSVLEGGEDSGFGSSLETLANRLRKLAKQGIEAEKQTAYFERVLRPAYDETLDRYFDALNSGDQNEIKNQEQALLNLDRLATQSMTLLRRQSPESSIPLLQTQYPELQGTLSAFSDRHHDLELVMRNNMSAYSTQAETLKKLANANRQQNDGTSQTLPHAGELRQIRGSGFPAIYSMPTYGSAADFYGNSTMTNNTDPFNTNSAISDSYRTGTGRVTRSAAATSVGPF